MPQFTVDPIVDPGAFDVLVAAGQASPGVFKLMGPGGRVYKWDVRDAPGIQGAFITYRGWRPTDGIKGRFEFWEPGQVQDFYDNFLPLFAIDNRKYRVNPVEVYHPALAANDINAMVCKKIGELKGDAKQLWWIELEWIEYRKAKIIKSTTPEGATGKNGPPKAKTVQERMCTSLTNQASQVFGEITGG